MAKFVTCLLPRSREMQELQVYCPSLEHDELSPLEPAPMPALLAQMACLALSLQACNATHADG